MRTSPSYSLLAVGLGAAFECAHLPVIRTSYPSFSLAGVECSPARRAFLRLSEPQLKIFDSCEEALRSESFDGAVVTTYPQGRGMILRQLVDAGIKTILCEKPLAVDDQTLREIRELVEQENLLVVPCHTWGCSPIVEALSVLSRLALKHPMKVNIRIRRLRPAHGASQSCPNWRVMPALSGGGILFDLGYHALYLAQRWVGGSPLTPVRIQAFLDDNGADWTTNAAFESPTADLIELDLSWLAVERTVEYEISSNGIVLTAQNNIVNLHSADSGRRVVFKDQNSVDDGVHLEWYRGVYASFVAALAKNAHPANELLREAFSTTTTLLKARDLMLSQTQVS